MKKRLWRWFLATTPVAAVVVGLSGSWRDVWLWGYVGVWSAFVLYAMLAIDEDVARERFRPPDQGADAVWLKFIRLVALVHVVIGVLDTGHWHLAPVPSWLRSIGLGGMVLSYALVFGAMTVNRFFSGVVRVQKDRGHQVVDRGPYAVVRHPGYAGMIVGIPISALALGSWLAVALATIYSALILRRVAFEDGYLRAKLEGYAAYAERVPYRLVPRVW